MKKNLFIFLMLLLGSNVTFSQTDTIISDLFNLSLEELMNVEVEVVTKKALALRENPAIVTVISETDIQNSGARDIKEVFELFVPGFQFGVDVEGAVGMSVRGIWAFEGKTLLMIDGIEMNEEMFGSVMFGNHFTVDNVKKIEISRGPGSAIYGGYAGLSVINIITKGANMNCGFISSSYSQMSKTYAQRYLNAGFGKEINNFLFSINAAYSQGVRSQNENVDYYLNSIAMQDNSTIYSTFLNTNIKYKGLDIRLISDLYQYKQVDLWGENYTNGALNQKTDSHIGQIKYKFEISEKHILAPFFIFKYQKPWNVDVPEQDYVNSKFVAKYTTGINHSWEINSNFNILSGFEYYNNSLNLPEDYKTYEETFTNNSNSISISNITLFSQAIYLNKIVNVTVGGRFDQSSEYGNSFVPRLALTKVIDKLHLKAMFSQSFRIPGGIIPNRIPGGVDGIKPENATNYEFEIGYRLGENLYFGVNAFSISFEKLISYGSDPSTGLGTYVNSGTIGSNGLEAELKYKSKYVNFMLNYAYHMATNYDENSNVVPENEEMFLAFSPQRLNSMINISLNAKLSFNISALYFSDRYAYTYDNGTSEVLEKFSSEVIVNSNFRITKLIDNHLDITIGVNNILDSKMIYLQPYNGQHAPLPGLSRAATIKVFYNF
ncbi:MAG: TonB-dependent receptor plug domain-containing protein [Bacteroidales bacterium]|nr:TonB-dependent receptor plug domain-containing protein [Bacteroidales bacterium]